MMMVLSGRPFARQYCQAIFRADSFDSEPPEVNQTFASASLNRAASLAARSSCGSLVKNAVCANDSFSACSWDSFYDVGVAVPEAGDRGAAAHIEVLPPRIVIDVHALGASGSWISRTGIPVENR